MKIDKIHTDQIKLKFYGMSSKEDLVDLINYVNVLMFGEKSRPIQLKSLTFFANPTLFEKRYETFTIKKKSGGDRTIHSPATGLKSIQRSLNVILQTLSEPHRAATGFIPGKSIVDNAKLHVNQNYVFNIDLKDFFHSFDRNRVKVGLMKPPFNLKEQKEPLAFFIACLCTHPFSINESLKVVLPQGSPTSPTLTNILCVTLDRRLNGLAKRFNAKYSRYADDITFSSSHNIFTNEDFHAELKRIIEKDQGLTINPCKTRLQKTQYRQETTGLTVNDKVNVRKRYVKQIRMWLYYWEKYGYSHANKIFRKDYNKDKGHLNNTNASLVHVISGKLEYLKMVKGQADTTYSKLKARCELLTNKENPINSILKIWEKDGIENAMAAYFKKSTHP
jgi:RNA-directed DNA polymerase